MIIYWFTELFKEFQEEIIDNYNDIFDELINSLDFNEEMVTSIFYTLFR